MIDYLKKYLKYNAVSLLKRDVKIFINGLPNLIKIGWYNKYNWDYSYAINFLIYKLEALDKECKDYNHIKETIKHLKISVSEDSKISFKEKDDSWQIAMDLLKQYGRGWWF